MPTRAAMRSPHFNAGIAARTRRIQRAAWQARPPLRCRGCGGDLTLRTPHPGVTTWHTRCLEAARTRGDTA